ncbi:STAS domain-containing protein [Streptomyces sp. enrichment culture]|uniref:STAS domain-containing protein n=1 Tax=Streptomyces sp. enrichment culture TaxID=1795815 RepID=UPI003F5428BF
MVRLSGEITGVNAERIGRRLQKATESRASILEIDLADVRYVSSAGGTAFVLALRAAQDRGTRVIATHVGAQPLGALRQLGLERALDVYEGDAPLSGPFDEC